MYLNLTTTSAALMLIGLMSSNIALAQNTPLSQSDACDEHKQQEPNADQQDKKADGDDALLPIAKTRRPSDRIGTAAPDPQDEPDACSTCGTGLVALGITASAPLSLVGALGILAADKAGWIQNDPMASFGIPLWGAGLGCAGVHVFFAVISAVAFSRDFKALLSSDDDNPNEIETKIKPKPKHDQVKKPGLAIEASAPYGLAY